MSQGNAATLLIIVWREVECFVYHFFTVRPDYNSEKYQKVHICQFAKVTRVRFVDYSVYSFRILVTEFVASSKSAKLS